MRITLRAHPFSVSASFLQPQMDHSRLLGYQRSAVMRCSAGPCIPKSFAALSVLMALSMSTYYTLSRAISQARVQLRRGKWRHRWQTPLGGFIFHHSHQARLATRLSPARSQHMPSSPRRRRPCSTWPTFTRMPMTRHSFRNFAYRTWSAWIWRSYARWPTGRLNQSCVALPSGWQRRRQRHTKRCEGLSA